MKITFNKRQKKNADLILERVDNIEYWKQIKDLFTTLLEETDVEYFIFTDTKMKLPEDLDKPFYVLTDELEDWEFIIHRSLLEQINITKISSLRFDRNPNKTSGVEILLRKELERLNVEISRLD